MTKPGTQVLKANPRKRFTRFEGSGPLSHLRWRSPRNCSKTTKCSEIIDPTLPAWYGGKELEGQRFHFTVGREGPNKQKTNKKSGDQFSFFFMLFTVILTSPYSEFENQGPATLHNSS